MAVPKKKTSQSRRDKRRYSNHWTLSRVQTVDCSNCGKPTRPHRICDECGFYAGKQIINPDTSDA